MVDQMVRLTDIREISYRISTLFEDPAQLQISLRAEGCVHNPLDIRKSLLSGIAMGERA